MDNSRARSAPAQSKMTFSAIQGIKDNDAKGETGRGTLFFLRIEHGDQVTEHEWGLLDELAGRFDPAAVLKPYRELQVKAEAEAAAREADRKVEQLKAREATVKEDPILMVIIDEVLSDGAKAVEEFKAGKEKALNSLIGKVIGAAKGKGFQPDAFTVHRLLERRIGKPG